MLRLPRLWMEGDAPFLLQGFAASGDSVRSVAEAFNEVLPLRVTDHGTAIRVRQADANLPRAFNRDELGASAGEKRVHRLHLETRPQGSVPAHLALRYSDPQLDYQPGLQRSAIEGGSRREARIDFAAVLSSEAARHLAESCLSGQFAGRQTARLYLPWSRIDLRPGFDFVLPQQAGRWRLVATALEAMQVRMDFRRLPEGSGVALATDPGRSTSEADLLHGPTTLRLIDLPPIEAGAAGKPLVAAMAAGAQPGWRRAALMLSTDAGNSWSEVGSTAAPATLGVAETGLGPAGWAMVDQINSVDVVLLNTMMTLSGCDAAALAAGSNAAMIGDELIQFGSAALIGPVRYRLSFLLGGRRGTEWAIDGHVAGEEFALLDRNSMELLDLAPGIAPVMLIASGVGDSVSPPVKSLAETGRALMPPSPLHLRWTDLPNGDARIEWVRRSRDGWLWLDQVDAPIIEQSELYLLTLRPSVGAPRDVAISTPFWVYPATDRATDLAAGAHSIIAEIRQIGTYGRSRPAILSHIL